MKMKNLIFCVAMNFISAIVLIGAGAMEMNRHDRGMSMGGMER